MIERTFIEVVLRRIKPLETEVKGYDPHVSDSAMLDELAQLILLEPAAGANKADDTELDLASDKEMDEEGNVRCIKGSKNYLRRQEMRFLNFEAEKCMTVDQQSDAKMSPTQWGTSHILVIEAFWVIRGVSFCKNSPLSIALMSLALSVDMWLPATQLSSGQNTSVWVDSIRLSASCGSESVAILCKTACTEFGSKWPRSER